jgi:peptidoglycan biosynthesis protein MviN/MurJ (putative lipid II flippase)
MSAKRQMVRSSMVVAFFNLLGGLSGILVETSIAANLGLSARSDTFYVAYTIPYIITNLLTATGQFSLVPFFASLEPNEKDNDLWRGFSYVSNIIFLGLGASPSSACWHHPGLLTASRRDSPPRKTQSPPSFPAGFS